MLRRVTFTVMKDSDCEHSVTIGRSEGSGSYCYADEAEAEVARWKAEALAARKLLYWFDGGHEPGWIYDGSATREDHENYSVIRRENGGE